MTSSFPSNYDFKKNWNIVHPLLLSHKYRMLYKTAIFFYTGTNWEINSPYAHASSKDVYVNYCDKLNEKFMEEFRKTHPRHKLVRKLEQLTKKYMKYEDDDVGDELFKIENKITEKAPHNADWRNDLNSYSISGACFWVNPIVSLELAKEIEPNEKWVIAKSFDEEGSGHATVMNESETKYFDIIFTWQDTPQEQGKEIYELLHKNPIEKYQNWYNAMDEETNF